MRYTIRLVLSTCLVLLYVILAFPQKGDVAGWQGTRWGMAERDLMGLFGSRLTRLAEPERFYKAHVDHTIANIEMGGELFTVHFQMSNDSNRLIQILVRLNEMKAHVPREKIFQFIEGTLQLEYGPPTKRADDVRDQSTSTYASVYRDRIWVFPTTIVELHYGWDSQISASLLTITYKPSSSVG